MKELSDHCNVNVEFEIVTDGSGGGVSVETILDKTDESDGPKSL